MSNHAAYTELLYQCQALRSDQSDLPGELAGRTICDLWGMCLPVFERVELMGASLQVESDPREYEKDTIIDTNQMSL